jgi:integrase
MAQKNTPPVPERKIKRLKNANGHGTVYFSKSRNRYIAQFYDIKNKRRTKICRRQSDAQTWLDEQKRVRHYGQSTYTPNPNMTISEFLTQWVEHRKNSIAPETYRNYKSTIENRIKPVIGDVKTKDLTPQAVESLIGDLIRDGFKPGTIKGVYAVLRAAFRYAVRMGDLNTNPITKVSPPSSQSNAIKHIPKVDFEKIYREASLHPYLHARVEVGMMMGLRPGEVRGLRWSDIDWDERNLTIERQLQRVKDEGLVFRPVKQKESRTIPLSETQINILKTHLDFQQMSTKGWVENLGLIFPNTIGKPLDAKREHTWWKSLLKRAGVGEYSIYQMRKTAFTHFANLGVPQATLLAYSGHSNISTVFKHYAFATSEAMDSAIAGMDSIRPTT